MLHYVTKQKGALELLHLIFALFNIKLLMPFSVKDALLSWQGCFVGKKRNKVWRSSSFILILDPMKGEKSKSI